MLSVIVDTIFKILQPFSHLFNATRTSKHTQEIEITWCLFKGGPKQGKIIRPVGLISCPILQGAQKAIVTFQLLATYAMQTLMQSTYLLAMENIFGCWKNFFCHFMTQ